MTRPTTSAAIARRWHFRAPDKLLHPSDPDPAIHIGVTNHWSGHEWRICPKCGEAQVVPIKATKRKCKMTPRCDGQLARLETT